MIEIPLRRRDGTVAAITVIDDADAPLAEHRWSLTVGGYAQRGVRVDGRRRLLYLHREVLGLRHGDGLEVDHKDRDRLNNRRSNLRVVTHAQNGQNVPLQPGRSSPHRGVCFEAWSGRWKASATLNGRQHNLGRFDIEADAAEAAREFRRVHMPLA